MPGRRPPGHREHDPQPPPPVRHLAPLLLLVASPLAAQDPPPVVPSLREGATVRVRIAGDRGARGLPSLRAGWVRTSTPDSLVLRHEGYLFVRAVPWRDVVRLDTLVGRPSRRGHAIAGFVLLGTVGALVGAIASGMDADPCQPHCHREAIGAAAVGALSAGAVGAAIMGWALPPTRRWATVIPDRMGAP